MIQRVQKPFNPCIRGLIIRVSFAFPIFIVMRFATFVAFMLPLAAFADSIPSIPFNSDLCPELQNAVSQFSNAFASTTGSLASVVSQLSVSNSGRELLQFVPDPSSNLTRFTFGPGGGPSNTARYVNILCAYTMVKNELIRRFCSL